MRKITIKIPGWAIVIGAIILIILTIGLTTTFIRASGRFNLPLSWILTPSGTSVDADNDGVIDAGVPSGVIITWSGTTSTIPTGWQLCDGTNSTPDLSDKFIYGISSGENPGATGGTSTHSHGVGSYTAPAHTHGAGSYEAPAHTHEFSGVTDAYGISTWAGNNITSAVTRSHSHTFSGSTELGGDASITGDSGTGGGVAITGTSASEDSLPPYYKLAFIMKL